MSNRERKYRAWHPEWKEMIHSVHENWFGKREFYPFCFPVGFSHYPQDDKWVIMSWTGLKDKNGKDIYEGDILSAKRTVTGLPLGDGKCAEVFGPPSNHPIETRSWEEIIVAEINISENEMIFRLPKEGGTYQERGKPLQWQIIGNIYQNPELLQLPTTEK